MIMLTTEITDREICIGFGDMNNINFSIINYMILVLIAVVRIGSDYRVF